MIFFLNLLKKLFAALPLFQLPENSEQNKGKSNNLKKGWKEKPEEFTQGSLKEARQNIPSTAVFTMSECHSRKLFNANKVEYFSMSEYFFHIDVQIHTETSKLEAPACVSAQAVALNK